MKMINVGPMRIPKDQLDTLVKVLGATITEETPEFRCCVEHTGCGNMIDCPYNLEELFSHLAPGETSTVVCEEIDELVCIHRSKGV